ncbi:MAG TPA: ABC transporter substrate-binding protein [Anaerolineales bacterium]|nr:ABC transporter substrate-binding protein [Anaerolineales bacterium]
MKHTVRLILLAAALTSFVAGCAPAPSGPVTIRVGVLPILDALPMYVAQAEGYFAEAGVTVSFVPVASAAERDQLMQTDGIDAMINDLVSTMLYNQNGRQIVIVRMARTATAEDPQYRILASKDSGLSTPADLAGVPIGISEGTVIAYVTERLLTAEGLAPEDITTVAVPKIADRMALLDSGELQAATLPDPLSSLALQSGARLILDDTAHPEYGNSVISFRAAFVDASPRAVRSFLAALEKAVDAVNADKTRWNSLLTEQQLVPAPLLASYEVPTFPNASVPTEAQFDDVLAWTKAKGLVTADVSYDGSVDESYLP